MDCLYRLEKTTHEGRSEEEKTADASVEAINFFSGLLSGIETELMYMMKIYRERWPGNGILVAGGAGFIASRSIELSN